MVLVSLGNGKTIRGELLSQEQLKALMHPLRLGILRELRTPQYAAGLAKKLGVSEQKLYYHMKKLVSAGLIRETGRIEKRGATAVLYEVKGQAFTILIDDSSKGVIRDFINATMVVGSPDPHGPHKTRARDNYYAAELGLFLGGFNPEINVKTDTEMKAGDFKNNLILIGGPVVNMVTAKVNDKLRFRFTTNNGNVIESTKTGKKYYDEEVGVICITKNPWAQNKKVLVLAGKGFAGTKAAITGFIKHHTRISGDGLIVEGVDLDGDGIIDNVEIIED